MNVLTKTRPTNKKLAVIYWRDAAMHGRDQMDVEECQNLGLVSGIAVGIIVKEDTESITLAMDCFPEQRGIYENNYRCLASYPKSGIQKIFRMALPSQGKSARRDRNGKQS